MAKSPNQKQKLLRILEILKDKTDEEHYISRSDLIDALKDYDIEAERKSIYDDIEVLIDMGYDIRKSKKKDGGYCLASREFDRSEILPLVDAVSSSRFITAKKSRELIKKLEGFLSKYEASDLHRDVHVSNRIKTDNESIFYVVDAVSRAITSKKKITFHYCDWNNKKEFVPRHNNKLYLDCPLSLFWDDEKYYLIGYDEEFNEIRHYRCDKMKDVTVTDEPICKNDIIEKFDPVHYENMTFGMYNGKEEYVTICFKDTLCGVMIDRFGKDPTFRKENDGYLSIRVQVKVSPQFFGWLTGLGGDVFLKAPQNIVDEYTDYLKKLLLNY